MAGIIGFFIALQVVLLFFMTFHDWIHLPPLTDIRALEKRSTKAGRLLNSALFFVLIAVPLWLTCRYQPDFPRWVLIQLVALYGLLSLGTIFTWWVPYFGTSSEEHKKAFQEYQNTHHFLPARGDNVIPNTLHVILHLQIWICLGVSVYLMVSRLVGQ